MRILLLSFYFKPDLCAGSFRTSALVEELKKYNDCEIEVITTLPNRYASFSAEAKQFEKEENVTVHRIKLPSHKSGMLDQIKAFTAYYSAARRIANQAHYDVVFATSSRLFTAFLGARIAKAKSLPLYLDIRDIFVDTIKDVLSPKISLVAKPIFSLIEKYTFSKAQRINLVSKGFEHYFRQRYPKAEYRWYTNGIDNEFLSASNDVVENKNNVLKVLYAGNIGEGQGLHTILPELAKSLEGRVEFDVIGDGGRKPQLVEALELGGVSNVNLLPPVNRAELIKCYQKADVLFLHLNDYPAFKKVLPSKIFEYAALGKPIWAGVSGFSAEFMTQEVENAQVFEPGNAEHAKAALELLDISFTERTQFKEKYSRKRIMAEMSNDLVEFTERGGKS